MSSPKENIINIVETSKALQANQKRTLIWKILKLITIFTVISVAVAVIIVFVVVPIVFMLSEEIQRLAMFTNVFLLDDPIDFQKYEKPGIRNIYISVESKEDDSILSLGAFHILPKELIKDAVAYKDYDYNNALKNSNYSVLLYFHGSGEDRTDSIHKYEVLNLYFHVIAFDYRDYGDSTSSKLSEEAIANDSVQVYKWVKKKTNASIYIWGHSLGTALSTLTMVRLKNEGLFPKGLILEAPFTSMREEIPNHPYGKIFSWLPWFTATILDPLQKNGFRFEIDKNILEVECPIMILHSEDDTIIPYTLGKKLYETAKVGRNNTNIVYHQFSAQNRYDHFFLYKDKNLPKYIESFIFMCNYGNKRE